MLLKKDVASSTLMRFGMVFLILFAITQRPVPLQSFVGEAWADGIRGLLISLSGGLNILSIVKRRQFSG